MTLFSDPNFPDNSILPDNVGNPLGEKTKLSPQETKAKEAALNNLPAPQNPSPLTSHQVTSDVDSKQAAGVNVVAGFGPKEDQTEVFSFENVSDEEMDGDSFSACLSEKDLLINEDNFKVANHERGALENPIEFNGKLYSAEDLSSSPDVNEVNANGLTLLQILVQKKDQADALGLLLKNPCLKIDPRDLRECTPLHYACYLGNLEALKALIGARADLSVVTNNGENALHIAVQNNQVEVAKYLLRMSLLDINQKDKDGWTPLHDACYDGHLEAVKALIKAGADPFIKNNEGYTAYSLIKGYWVGSVQDRKELLALLKSEIMPEKVVERAYEKWLFKWKELAHLRELEGKVRFFAKGGSELLDIQLEGSHFVRSFQRHVSKSFSAEKIKKELEGCCSLQVLSEISDAMDAAYQARAAEEIFDRIQGGKVTVIPFGFFGHHVEACVVGNFFVICNRGAAQHEGKNYEVFLFDPKKLTVEHIQMLLDCQSKTESDYQEVYEKLKEELFQQGPVEQALESMEIGAQIVGNCTWANLEGIVQALFVLLSLPKELSSVSTSSISTTIKQQQNTFRVWQREYSELRAEKFYKTMHQLREEGFFSSATIDSLGWNEFFDLYREFAARGLDEKSGISLTKESSLMRRTWAYLSYTISRFTSHLLIAVGV